MLKWWAQSFLVGIERVVVGFRDDEGVVHRLHAYATKQLPKQQVRGESTTLGKWRHLAILSCIFVYICVTPTA